VFDHHPFGVLSVGLNSTRYLQIALLPSVTAVATQATEHAAWEPTCDGQPDCTFGPVGVQNILHCSDFTTTSQDVVCAQQLSYFLFVVVVVVKYSTRE